MDSRLEVNDTLNLKNKIQSNHIKTSWVIWNTSRNLELGGFVELSLNFDSPQEFAKLEIPQPGGETHAKEVFPKFKVPSCLGNSLRGQISSGSSQSLRRSPEHGEKLGQKVQGERFGSICQERRGQETRRAHSGTRTACRPEGAGDRSP